MRYLKSPRRVVVTGIGAVTPAGLSFARSWESILAKNSKGAPISIFDASQMPSGIAYEVDPKIFDDEGLFQNPEEKRLSTRATYFGLAATRAALKESGLPNDAVDPYRTAVSYGVGVPAADFQWLGQVFFGKHLEDESITDHRKYFPYVLTSHVSRIANARGGNYGVQTACASSGQSIGEAFELIQDDLADVVITGGADSMINPLHIAGFNLLGTLATKYIDPARASRPFDIDRNGFVMGEGACTLIFEEREHALKRGAPILAEICGYGVTASAYRVTDLHPEGHGPLEAIQMAMEQSGVEPKDIQYINAHGTSTQLNDSCESLAITKVFGESISTVKVSSTKSITGHLISAAGAIECAFCVQAIRQSVLPPSAHVDTQDANCAIPLTKSEPENAEVRFALSNSVGFGGSNTAIIVGRSDA